MQVQALKYNHYSFKETLLYFLYFFGRAFVIAFFAFIACACLISFIIIGDTIYNLQKGEKVVPLFGEYVIITQSMVPTIKINDAVIVKRSTRDELDIGDVITFQSTDDRYAGLTITHRIVGMQSLSNGNLVYRTKGDNNKIEDSSVVLEDNIYGKVILKLPKFGYVQNFLKTPLGFILFIGLPIFMIIVININDRKNKKRLM